MVVMIKATPATALAAKVTATDTEAKPLPRITDSRRETIMNGLLDWHIESRRSKDDSNYHATIARLARRTKLNHQQVAGIAANLSRGTYGDISTLIRRRKADLRRAAAS